MHEFTEQKSLAIATTGTNAVFVIFGGTGDLTKRKLLPALYSLAAEQRLSDGFSVIVIGRRDKDTEEYRNEARGYVEQYTRLQFQQEVWDSLQNRIYYLKLDFANHQGFGVLKQLLEKLDRQYRTDGNRLFYLAVAPQHFEPIITGLHENELMSKSNRGWKRLMIEKPFGSDLHSATELNRKISSMVDEKDIFRVDHYLGKEMVQNILAVRFANSLFEPLWNHNYIDNIQITSSEVLGVEERGNYFDHTGILKDMLQNHLLQMLAIIGMEPPVSLEPEMIRDEKVKVLRSLRMFQEFYVSTDIVRGQYGSGYLNGQLVPGYRQEDHVKPDSDTETFVALKAYIDNFRWGGVPFYIRSGKRLDKKCTQIVVEFKRLPGINFYNEFQDNSPNLLVIKIQPEEGFFFRINAKRPQSELAIEQVKMDYCQSCRVEYNSPEAYERILSEAMRNNTALFTRWDELEASWKFVESIERSVRNRKDQLHYYSAGTDGPKDAHQLIAQDGCTWHEIG